jgi:hypothetical protein
MLLLPSVTDTLATGDGGAAVTVSIALPVLPSLVAMMLAVPGFSAVTSPVDETVATLLLELLQVTVRPVSVLPFASCVTAVAWVVAPSWMLVLARLTLTVFTGGGGARVTVTLAPPLLPSLVAVIVAVPGRSAVTTPLEDTMAMSGADDDQLTLRPVSTVPLASSSTAVAVVVEPVCSAELARLTDTVFTGRSVTISDAVPLLPSLVPVIVTLPAFTAVTTPFADTVATFGFELLHVTVRPVSSAPFSSRVIAVACVVAPSTMVLFARLTKTVATGNGGGGATVSAALPALPSLVAVIVAEPPPTAVTTPVCDTVATFVFELLHTIERSVSVAPDASLVTAVAWVVPPTARLEFASVTVTVATGVVGGNVTVRFALPLFPSAVAVIVALPGRKVNT